LPSKYSFVCFDELLLMLVEFGYYFWIFFIHIFVIEGRSI